MRLLDALTGGTPPVVTQPENKGRVGRGVGQGSFDALLEQAGRRQNTELATDTQSRNRERDNTNRTSAASSPDNRAERRQVRSSSAASETTSVATPNESYEEVSEVTIAATQESKASDEADFDEQQAIAAIAAILQVPVEMVMEWLEQLDMVPQDLLDPQNVLKLLKLALGADTPAALVTDPDFPGAYKAINEAMADLADLGNVNPALKAAIAEMTQTNQANGQAVESNGLQLQAAEYEGLQVLSEDGELVVTERSASNETSVDTSKSQIQTAPTTEAAKDAIELLGTSTDEPIEDVQIANQNVSLDIAKARVEQTIRQAAPQAVDVADVIEQIMSQVRVTNLGGQFTEMRMTLRPETLGDIVLRVLTQNGIVIAQFEAESQRVKEALEANFNQLRDALTEQGIAFSELSVSVRQDEDERMNQFDRARQSTRGRMESIESVQEEPEAVSYHNGVIDVTA